MKKVSSHSKKRRKTNARPAQDASGSNQTRASRRPAPMRFVALPDLRNGVVQKGALVLVPADFLILAHPQWAGSFLSALAESKYPADLVAAIRGAGNGPSSKPRRPRSSGKASAVSTANPGPASDPVSPESETPFLEAPSAKSTDATSASTTRCQTARRTSPDSSKA